MSPEVAKGESADGRADLYSLGVTLFQVMTRKLPYDGESSVAVIRQHLAAPIPAMADIPSVTPAMKRIVRRLLEKDPADRFQSANHVIMAINREMKASFEFEPVEIRRRQMLTLMGSFVGRADELAELKLSFEQRCLGRTDIGQAFPRFLRISGTTGIGKTRLSNEFKNHVQLSHAHFLRAVCLEGQSQPFAAVRQLIGAVSEAMPVIGGPDLGLWGPDAARGASPSSPRSSAAETPPDRLAVLDKGCEILLRASDVAPVVLHVEDIQWCDEDSLEFIQHLLRKIRSIDEDYAGPSGNSAARRPALLVSATFSTDQPLKDRQKSLIESLASFEGSVDVRLEPFADADVRRLMDQATGESDFPPRVLQDILRGCRGVPLLVEQALARLAEQDIEVMPDGRWILPAELMSFPMPENSVGETFAGRIRDIAGSRLRVVQILALLNQPAQAVLIAKAAEIGVPDVLSCVSDLQQTGLVAAQQTTDGLSYFLAHGDLRPAILKTLTEEQVRTLHGRIGALMEDMTRAGERVSPQRLAFHFMQTADTERAVDYGIKAADEAVTQFAYSAAVDILDKCILMAEPAPSGIGPSPTARRRIAEMLQRRGGALRQNGSLPKAAADLERAAGTFESLNDRDGFAQCLLALANIFLVSGNGSGAADCAGRALDLVTATGNTTAALRSNTILGICECWAFRRYDDAEKRFQECQRLSRVHGLEGHMPKVLCGFGQLRIVQYRYDEALSMFARGLWIARKIRNSAEIAHCSEQIGCVFLDTARFSRAIKYLNLSLRHSRNAGLLTQSVNVLLNIGMALTAGGSQREAIVDFGQARKLSRLMGYVVQETRSLFLLARAYHETSMYAKALEAANGALALATRDNDRIESLNMLAKVNLTLGAASIAVERLTEAVQIAKDRGLERFRGQSLFILAECRLQMESIEMAAACAQEALDVARKTNLNVTQMLLLALLMDIEIERNDAAAAERHLADAISQAGRMGPDAGGSVILNARGRFALARRSVDQDLLASVEHAARRMEDLEQLDAYQSMAYLAARLCAAVGDMPKAVTYCRRATDALKQMCAQVPPEHIEGFMNVKSRKRAMEEMKAIMRKAAEGKTAS
jgi:tetratricopeptide (TPR) repeat protein